MQANKRVTLRTVEPARTGRRWYPGRLFFLGVFLLGGCTVGPKYVRPSTDVPADYKETKDWKVAQPSAEAIKGKWWEVYQDPQLNTLEEKIDVSNQSLKSAQAQFLQARAAVRISRSFQFPTVTADPAIARERFSQNRPLGVVGATQTFNDFQVPGLDATYELDVWGRVRRTVEQSRSQAQASAADLASVGLSLHAELATDYFQLRGLDAQIQLLTSTVEAFQKALDLTQSRFNGGLASGVDVAQAKTQLETARAQLKDQGVQRTAFEHAIAVLTGQPPSTFALAPLPLDTPPPTIPSGLPSDLLERRPDISAAERRMQAANAQIGIARAAYFPTITLTGQGGFESIAAGTLFQGPSGLWAVGGTALETLFDAGRRRGASEQAKAAYDQSIDDYRQTVLTAFQEVEDNLAALRILQDEAQTEDVAVGAAKHSVELSITRYKGGVANYLEVTTAQNAALIDEVTALTILTRRMTASVLLIKAIGGGWNVSQIPHV
ncbi:MAG: efflux transporter outer membrane subunit [Candidatus Acidiferrales bacterium]